MDDSNFSDNKEDEQFLSHFSSVGNSPRGSNEDNNYNINNSLRGSNEDNNYNINNYLRGSNEDNNYNINNSLRGSNEDINYNIIQQIIQINIPGINNDNPGDNIQTQVQTQVQELNQNISIIFQKKEKTKLGRKRKRSNEIGEHNKYTVDHIVHKIKTHLIKCLMTFINAVFFLNGYEDKILQINAERANNNTIEDNEELLKMTLKDLFSFPISTKNGKIHYENQNHNKEVLDKIYKEENHFVNRVLDSTFFECIKHFRGTEFKYALFGLEDYYNIIIEELEEQYEEDYVKKFKKVLLDYETKIKKMQSKKEQI